jgi:hypothetical protein
MFQRGTQSIPTLHGANTSILHCNPPLIKYVKRSTHTRACTCINILSQRTKTKNPTVLAARLLNFSPSINTRCTCVACRSLG